MLKLRSSSPSRTRRRRTAAISTVALSPAAVLLIRGVSGSNSTTSSATNIASPTPLPTTASIASPTPLSAAANATSTITVELPAAVVASPTSLPTGSNATSTFTTDQPSARPTKPRINTIGNNGKPVEFYPLGLCQGDCDNDDECAEGLICHQRDSLEAVPGCSGGESEIDPTDFCIPPPVYTASPTVSASPTPLPTISTSPTVSHAPSHLPSHNPTPSPTVGASEPVRLRLYWQRNYMWQDTRRETWWCMQCRSGPCKQNTIIEVDWCNKSSRQKFQYYEYDNTFRPMDNPDLCFEENGYNFETNPIKLKPCNGSSKQKFMGFKEDPDTPFEFISGRNGNYCVTQAHHPKAHERIFPQICRRARNHYTNKWVVY